MLDCKLLQLIKGLEFLTLKLFLFAFSSVQLLRFDCKRILSFLKLVTCYGKIFIELFGLIFESFDGLILFLDVGLKVLLSLFSVLVLTFLARFVVLKFFVLVFYLLHFVFFTKELVFHLTDALLKTTHVTFVL